MIWVRERYIAHSLFEDTGREMFCELFGPLHSLEAEWRAQGATAKEIAMTAFDWDYVLLAGLTVSTGARTGIAPQIIEDTPEHRIARDHMGRMTKLIKQSATIPLPMDYPVTCMEDWLKIKHWYEFSENRIDIEGLRRCRDLRDKGYLTMIGMPGGFDEPRQLLGEEELCIACYEDPEMIHDMLSTIADTCVKVIERVKEYVRLDALIVHEDMAGKSGPLFGPAQIMEFFHPYYTKVWAAAKDAGARLFSQDSDGNMEPVLDALLACGLNCIHPCEPAAGMDIVKLHRKYDGRLCFKGGIDKFALRGDFDTIRTELTYKMQPDLMGGGIIWGLDHRIPNGVPIENYRYYVNLGRELLNLPPITAEGWARMAF